MSESQPADDRNQTGPLPLAKPGCVTVRCRENGPFVVELPPAEGPDSPGFLVIDHEGGEFPLPTHKRAVALCRCGQSANRPFCDGSHREAGFRAPERAPAES